MHARIFMALMILGAVLAAGCHNSADPGSATPYYPLTAGNTWTYTVTDSVFNFRPASPGITLDIPNIRVTLRTTCIGPDTLAGFGAVWKFQTEQIPSAGTPGLWYYSYRHDSLFCLQGTGGYTDVLPKQSAGVTLRSRHFSIPCAAGRVMIGEPGLSSVSSGLFSPGNSGEHLRYVFPLFVNRSWKISTDPRNFSMTKTVTSRLKMKSPVGMIDAYAITVQWDFNGDGIPEKGIACTEFLSPLGLLGRDYLFTDMVVSTPEYPGGAGLVDITEHCAITSMDVHP